MIILSREKTLKKQIKIPVFTTKLKEKATVVSISYNSSRNYNFSNWFESCNHINELKEENKDYENSDSHSNFSMDTSNFYEGKLWVLEIREEITSDEYRIL